jgi:hypothetical protein
VPSEPTEEADAKAAEWSSEGDDYFNRNHFHLRQSVSYDVSCNTKACSDCTLCDRRQFPVWEYKMDDVVRCLDSLSVKRNKLPIHIAFVGDSTVRQHFISFIQVS